MHRVQDGRSDPVASRLWKRAGSVINRLVWVRVFVIDHRGAAVWNAWLPTAWLNRSIIGHSGGVDRRPYSGHMRHQPRKTCLRWATNLGMCIQKKTQQSGTRSRGPNNEGELRIWLLVHRRAPFAQGWVPDLRLSSQQPAPQHNCA
jgi:hypothetical protein